MPKKKIYDPDKQVNKDAASGKFVSDEYASRNRSTTYAQTVDLPDSYPAAAEKSLTDDEHIKTAAEQIETNHRKLRENMLNGVETETVE